MLCFSLFHPLWLLLAILGGSSIVVLGDQIIIDEPPNGAAFHAGATIDIRYRGWYDLSSSRDVSLTMINMHSTIQWDGLIKLGGCIHCRS